MPIYEYRCSNCGHKLEALQKISEPLLVSCPSCHQDKLVKLMSAAGFQLKGSGWYATDFRGGGTAKPAAGDEAPKASADAAPSKDSKGDSKTPASTPDTASSGTGASTPASSTSPATKASTPTPSGGA